MTLVLRIPKGSKLTKEEMDDNLTYLQGLSSGKLSTGSFATFSGSIAGRVSALKTEVDGLSEVTGSFASTGSNTFVGNQAITGDLVIDGDITARTFYIDSASVMYTSGSTKFGDTAEDVHEFTGSILVQGAIVAESITGSFTGDGSGLTGLPITDTTSFATTGSNQFNGRQSISGSLTISGSFFQVGVGNNNTFIGRDAGIARTSGCNNTLIGKGAGVKLTSGQRNVAIGHLAGCSITTGESNVFVGEFAGASTATTCHNTFIGNSAGLNNLFGSDNTFIGSQAGGQNISGLHNTIVGRSAGSSAQTACGNTFVGKNTGCSTTAGFNTMMGYDAGQQNTTGVNNVFIGYAAGQNSIQGNSNTFVGTCSGTGQTIGTSNAFFGFSSGRDNGRGCSNTFLGSAAGQTNISGSYNTFVGAGAGQNSKACFNTFVGWQAGLNNGTGASNVMIGPSAGNSNTSGSANILVGQNAGLFNTSGSNNVMIGYEAGAKLPDSNSAGEQNTSIYIGNSTRTPETGQHNQIVIGHSAIGHGSNTVTIGNDDITETHLKGGVTGSSFTGSFVGDGSGLTNIAGISPVKVYRASIQDDGTFVTPTELENTTGRTITWTWNGNGYQAAINGGSIPLTSLMIRGEQAWNGTYGELFTVSEYRSSNNPIVNVKGWTGTTFTSSRISVGGTRSMLVEILIYN
jgi:hypothetical protein